MRSKQLKIIEKMDNSSAHRKNTYALASEVIVFIALTFSNMSSEDNPVTLAFFISIIINPDNPIKAVEHSNTAWISSTTWTIPATDEYPMKQASKAKPAVEPTIILMNLFADAVISSMSLRI